MFLNPWYLQQGANAALNSERSKFESDGVVVGQAGAELGAELLPGSASPSPPSSSEAMQEGEESSSPSPAPSLASCSSNTPARIHPATSQQLAALQSNLKPGWTVHITPEGRLYYCK